jgi:hypothetical protein
MLKQIPKSDVSIRPFKAYKEWSFVSGSDITLMEAENTSFYDTANDVTLGNGVTYNKHSLYGQLNSLFYANVDNPFYRVGIKSHQPASVSGERVFNGKAKILAIPQSIFGEQIKQGSLSLTDSVTSTTFVENGSGSLMNGTTIVGDVFYDHGLVVYTHTASLNTTLTGDWQIDFKSTETIYENEYLLIVNEDEFNISQNPSAVVKVGGVTSTFTDTNGITRTINEEQPVRYIRKKTTLDNGTTLDFRYGSGVNSAISGGFEHIDLSGSIDTTGSFLTPFITTIGLYDDNCDLVAVAKLPQPIKSEPDFPVNFIVRFDT